METNGMANKKSTTPESGQGDGSVCSHLRGSNARSNQLSQGQSVYVSHPFEGWATGTVLHLLGQDRVKVTLDNGQVLDRGVRDVLLKPEGGCLEACSNLTDLCPVNEATVLHCLCKRFEADVFYTRAGASMIAVNPCKEVPHLYGHKTIQEYHQRDNLENRQPLAPHIYEIAESAYVAMRRDIGRGDQSIVISGESGAGKTVSTKHLLRYLTVISSTPEKDTSADTSFPGSVIEKRVLVSNPILEAFGNATTPRNENSSRFGKFIRLQFDRTGAMIGGVVQTYLLEKTRVVHRKHQAEDGNFHVFNQLLTLGQLSSVPAWLESVKQGVCESGMSATHPLSASTPSLMETVQALTDVGVACVTQVHIFKTLLAILHLGQISFVSSSSHHGEGSDICTGDKASLRARDRCCRLLELSPHGLHQALVRRSIVSGGNSRRSVFSKACLVSEAEARRDTFMMLLYTRLFEWLVAFINNQIQAETFDHGINLLDIYGFEAFDTNSLEQLCINYANERLQQFYVSHFLQDLQSEFETEGIAWTHVTYADNKACVSAIDGTVGVFGTLNEEVYLNRKSDDAVLRDRIVDSTGKSGVVFRTRQLRQADSQHHFLVSHYAGDVVYDVTHTVSKNQDNIPQEFIQLLRQSTNPLVLDLFASDSLTDITEQTPASGKSKKRKTVLTKFKSSLDGLMGHLNRSACHYIRCIKPHGLCSPGQIDPNFVLQQLRACGTLESVEICRQGYPARMDYTDFVKRYGLLVQSQKRRNHNPPSSTTGGQPVKPESRGSMAAGDVQVNDSVQPKFSDVAKRKTRKRCGQTARNDNQSRCADILLQALPEEQSGRIERQFGHTKLFLSQVQFESLERMRTSAITSLVTRVQSAWRCHAQRSRYRKALQAIRLIQARWRRFARRKRLEQRHRAAACVQRAWETYKLRLSLRKLSHHSRVLKRVVHKWVHRHRQRQRDLNYSCDASQYPPQDHHDQTLDRNDLNTNPRCGVPFHLTPVDEFYSQESLTISTESLGTNPEKPDTDSDSNVVASSDDSGVMIGESSSSSSGCLPFTPAPTPVSVSVPAPAPCGEGDMGAPPPAKKLRIALQDYLHYGNRIATCRKLAEPGLRFHTRKSVLQYGHVTHHRHLVKGLPDALEASEEATQDSRKENKNNAD